MEQWVYNNEIVKRHSFYSSCGSTLNEVSNADYPGADYFDLGIVCLDMDAYEHRLSKKEPDCTVDAAIGIAPLSVPSTNRGGQRLLLIELKIGCTTTNGLDKEELERKVVYTRGLLGGECEVHKESVFVFQKNVAPQAKSWFERQSRRGGELKSCIPCSILEFCTAVKSPSELYVPINSKDAIICGLDGPRKRGDWQLFFKQVRYWCDRAWGYKCKYDILEYDSISEILREIWLDLDETEFDADDDVYCDKLILEEDYTFLKQKE